jgi:N-acyl-D-aspartate/D-glutamate deacylase
VPDFDVHIKGGTVVDGTRVPRFRGDVWVKDGRVAQIGGRPRGVADRVIDADGLIVAPGFVDLHTHYDAQIRWDPWCTVSSWHGVTSVVLGNCGFGFAPCRPEFRERSMRSMTRVEAIPYDAMNAGMPWDWETIPEYLDSLDAVPKGVNCLHYMPTAPLMIYVMGLEAAKTRPATDGERKEMQRLLHEGMDVGLCGFSIQRLGPNSVQADYDGSPMVTDTMADEDILALCAVLGERDEGFVQVTHNTGDPASDRAFVETMAAVARRPVLWNFVSAGTTDPSVHQGQLAWLDATREKGLPIFGQGSTVRPVEVFSLAEWNLYDNSAAWKHATTGTRDERIAKLRDPTVRAALRAEVDERTGTFKDASITIGGPLRDLVVQGVNRQPELLPYVGRSLQQVADAQGTSVVDAMIDLSLTGNLNVEFRGSTIPAQDARNVAAIINDSPYTFPGVSDGGAHTKFIINGNYTTDFLMWLVRDERLITLEEAHFRLSALPAHAAGFRDRGMLREGAPADIVVYDLDQLAFDPPDAGGEVAYDFPGGEWRRIQRAVGYKAILVNGDVTFEDGTGTGATPGKLLRGGRG